MNKLKNYVGILLGNGQTGPNSHYRRLTRYFNDATNQRWLWKLLLCYAIKLVLEALDQRMGGRYLVMDGTSWSFGKVKYQFLTLSVLYKNISIPIFWLELGKKGHSNLKERMALIKMAGILYDLRGMTLLADREYKGREWFEFLDSQGLFFIIRLTFGDYKHEVSGNIAYSHLCKKAKRGRVVETSLLIGGRTYRLIGTSDSKDERGLLLIISNLKTRKARKLLDTYRLRWKIETMFFHLKSNGFDIESIGMTSPRKVRLMMAIVVLAYVLCVCQGMKKLKKIRRQSAKHGGYQYESIFRKGYSVMAPVCLDIVLFIDTVSSLIDPRKVVKKPT